MSIQRKDASRARRTPQRRRTSVRGRLILGAALLLVPIFALAIFGYAQLDRHAERFRQVAVEASAEMHVVDQLLTNLDAAGVSGHDFLAGGDPERLADFSTSRARVDAGMVAATELDEREERNLGRKADARWVQVKRRIRRGQALRATGGTPTATMEAGHLADMSAAQTRIVRLLSASHAEIDEQVVMARRRRTRDRALVAVQMGVGVLIAAFGVLWLTRGTVRPLARLSTAADRLRAGHESERVRTDGPVEFADLGSAFNAMADTLQAQREELRQLAHADPLTGLPNRAAFVSRVDTAVARHPAAVLFLDLDDFKSVNDALGHAAGDALLLAVATRITTIVGPRGMVARLGGDEFGILMPGEADGDVHGSAVALAVRILSALLEPLRLAEVELRPAGSIGIAIGQGSSSSLLREADVAMYEAKRAGRGRHASFEPSMQEAASQRLAGIADLREALGRDQFHLLYQPIVDLRTRELRATEALVRWNHPTRGLVSPAEFIPLAEQTGLIVGIGAWVLRTACRQAAHWQSARPDANRSMTVNLSTRQLLEPDLVDQVRAALTESGLPPEMLVLEITESAVMADAGAASARLEDLRRLGVRLAIDDFGTGHSSLAYLRELPVHDLKIAREFVAEMETSPHDLALARGILALGHSLGLRVIAEGIETEGQDALLRGMGCDLGQGFLYARPLAASAVAPLIAAPVEAPQLGGFVATMAPGAAHLAYEPVDPGDSTALPA